MSLYLKKGTVELENSPSIISFAAAVGPMENDGPLKNCFDYVNEDTSLGEDSWEKAESALQKNAFKCAMKKGNLSEEEISMVFAGDLQNQCTSSAYGLREFDVPFVGLYGACSTMAESLAVAGVFTDAGACENAAALTSSHFCSAERQFRFPVNYGGQRTPTSQWTATAAGCAIVSKHGMPPYIKSVTFGKIADMGIKDANNMGAAMAGAAYQTINSHFEATGKTPDDFDLILTGDLAKIGSELLYDLFLKDGLKISDKHKDCGLMLYDLERQDVHAGASGCGCGASVLCGKILPEIAAGKFKNILFAATGALMSPTVVQQGESIPGISHAVHISIEQ